MISWSIISDAPYLEFTIMAWELVHFFGPATIKI